MTAAITGTLCKVSTDTIAALRGSVTIQVAGKPIKIPAGYAVKVSKSQAQIFRFDPREAGKGKLYGMGPLPENPGIQVAKKDESINWTTIDPRQFNPAFNRREVPPPVVAQVVPNVVQAAPIIPTSPVTPPTPVPERTFISWRGRTFDVPTGAVSAYLRLGATIP
jgi:hypothetical protein